MAKTIDNLSINMTDHTQFGGFIYLSDFYTNGCGHSSMYGSAIAKRIANDTKFDERCRKSILTNTGGITPCSEK